MRRKSNFAPSDSEEREDERCIGLHSNDTVEIVFLSACEDVQECIYECMYRRRLFYTVSKECRSRESSIVEVLFAKLPHPAPQVHVLHESAKWAPLGR